MVRSAVNFPVFWQQVILNFGAAVFYTLAVMLAEETWRFFGEELYWLRLMVLLLISLCCWGVYVLLQRDRQRSRVRHEFELREQSAAASGRLAAEMAHQLKNPLGIINNAAYLLQRQLTDATAAEPVTVIREEVGRCDKILTQLMDYARLSEGRIEPVDVNAAVERALTQALAAGATRGIRVVKRLAPGLPEFAAHRAQVEETFLNLLQNALEAMPQGGTLTVDTRYAGGGKIEIRISDTGVGIAAEDVERVFEAFYTTKPKGTGLGLAIVKNIVETYGGVIWVNSKLGEGTRVTVVWPAQLSTELED